MPKTFTATVPTKDLNVPAGSPAQGAYRWTLGTASGDLTQDTEGPSAQFTVDPGAYTLRCQALDAAGLPLGGPSNTASFTVEQDMVTVQIVEGGDITITF